MNWKPINQVLSNKSDLGLLLMTLFMIAYLVNTGGDHRKIKLFLVCAGLFLIVFFIKKINQPLLWYLFLMILINDLISDYFVRANHHFLLIYLTILIIIYLHNSKLDDFILNIKFLIVIVLLFSGIQKLLSLQFVSGNLYYYMINTGSFFKPILYFSSEMNDIVSNNKAQIASLGFTDPNQLTSITLKNIFPNLPIISLLFSWLTISLELVTGILFLWKPKHFVTHILFILLITGIFFTRFENGFITLLCISGIWLTDNLKIRSIYTALAIISLSFVITKIGFY